MQRSMPPPSLCDMERQCWSNSQLTSQLDNRRRREKRKHHRFPPPIARALFEEILSAIAETMGFAKAAGEDLEKYSNPDLPIDWRMRPSASNDTNARVIPSVFPSSTLIPMPVSATM